MTSSKSDEHPADNWRPHQLGAWLRDVKDERKWILQTTTKHGEVVGFLPRDSKIVVSGKPKTARKSFFTAAISLITASGKAAGPFEPAQSAPVPTLVLAAEGSKAGARDRWYWLWNGLGHDPAELDKLPLFYSHRDPITLEDKRWARKLEDTIVTEGIGLLIVDPLVMYMRGDENDVSEVASVMKILGGYCNKGKGTSVLFVHHLRKSARDGASFDVDEEIRGSSAIAGFYDTHYAIRQQFPGQTYSNLTQRSKDDEERLYILEWEIESGMGSASFELTHVDDFDTPPDSMHQRWLEQLPEGRTEFKAFELEAAWKTSDIKPIVGALFRSGKMTKSGNSYIVV